MPTPLDVKNAGKIQRLSRIRTVRLGDMRVSPAGVAQRKFNPNHNNVVNFDPDRMGIITVSHRDGVYWIVDGQHRKRGAQEFLGDGWENVKIEVLCYEGLTESQEADLFIDLNDATLVQAFDKFRAAVTAGREAQCDIDRIVRGLGLEITRQKRPGAIHAVTALENAYGNHGATVLRDGLAVIRDGFGDQGFESVIITAVTALLTRYGSRIDQERLKSKLNATRGGVKGVQNRAQAEKERVGGTTWQCNAAVMLSIYNQGLRGKQSLGSWWKSELEEAA